MIEVESIHDSVVLQGESHISITTDDADYLVIIEWLKFPEKYRYEDAHIVRVQEIKEGGSRWYEDGEWENIPNWSKIEEKVWEAFDSH